MVFLLENLRILRVLSTVYIIHIHIMTSTLSLLRLRSIIILCRGISIQSMRDGLRKHFLNSFFFHLKRTGIVGRPV